MVLTKATVLRPSWITPRGDLAALYLVMGDDRLALQEAQKVLEKHPDHRSALYNAAGALYKKGDYDKTLELFQRIPKYHPKDSAIHTRLGGVYVAQFKFTQASEKDGSGTPEACTPGTTNGNIDDRTSSGQGPDHRLVLVGAGLLLLAEHFVQGKAQSK